MSGPTDRSELAARLIPTFSLSTKSSPLTSPLPPNTSSSPSTRAAERFAVKGNAIVTGGAGDLGFVVSRALLEHGLSGLMIFDLDPATAEPKVESLQADFPAAKIAFTRVNVTNETEVQAAVANASHVLGGPVNILLAFAGVVECSHAAEVPVENWRRVFDINTTGSFICARAVHNALVASGRSSGGSIVFCASMSGITVNYPQPQIAYNASKAAVIAMTKSLAAEWAVDGVRVNSISPGYMDTVLNEGDGLEVARKIWLDRNPLGRMGVPEELCGAVVLLASQAGRYMTGSNVVIDGGQTIF